MFEQLSGFKVKGGYFKNEFSFEPFKCNKKPKKQNEPDEYEKDKTTVIVYGKNGSGKTSLAQAFYEYKYSPRAKIYSQVDFLHYRTSQVLDKTDIDLSKIYIYNQNFIDDNVRFNPNGKLKTIALFGKNITLADKIKHLENRAKNIIEKSERIKKELDILNDKEDLSSPSFYFTKIQNQIDVWARNQQKILGNSGKTPVTNAKCNEFTLLPLPTKKLNELEIEYNNKFEEFNKIVDGQEIELELTEIDFDNDLDANLTILLEKKIEQPIFTDRELKIKSMLSLQKNDLRLKEIKDTLYDPSIDCCPFCFQPIFQNYKTDLLKTLTHIFDSEEAQTHRNALELIIFPIIKKNLKVYIELDNKLVFEIEKLIDVCTQKIEQLKKIIEKKKVDIYTPIYLKELDLNVVPILEKINKYIRTLEQKRTNFNKKFKIIRVLKKELENLNKDITIWKIQDNVKQYNRQKKYLATLSSKFRKSYNIINKINTLIAEFEAQKKDILLAVDLINDYLAYIFFSKNRLSIAINSSGDGYSVKVNGENVELKQLSDGEKNAIALCYFFSLILENKELNDSFKDECLIVLDDPISSFDFNNKVGIYSFLRMMISTIHMANPNSRILIFTHQIEAMFHFDKIGSDIANEFKNKSSSSRILQKLWLLENNKLKNFSCENYNEYSKSLEYVCNFINQEDNFSENDVGNRLRKILEAFGTFFYKQGIDTLSTNDEVLAKITNENQRKHFKNLMYRLVLNGESHYKYLVQAMPETNFFDVLDLQEKIRTAKEVIIFLKLIEPLHLKNHLGDMLFSQVINWENEIFPKSV